MPCAWQNVIARLVEIWEESAIGREFVEGVSDARADSTYHALALLNIYLVSKDNLRGLSAPASQAFKSLTLVQLQRRAGVQMESCLDPAVRLAPETRLAILQ